MSMEGAFRGSCAGGRRGRQEGVGEDLLRAGLARQGIGLADDADGAGEPLGIRRAIAEAGDLGMAHLVLQGGDEALLLDRAIDQRLALGDRGNRRVIVLQRVDDAAVEGGDDGAQGVGTLVHQLAGDDQAVGIEVHAVVAVIDEAELLVRIDAGGLGREADRVDEAEGPVDLAALEHLLAQVRRHVGDRHLGRVDLGQAREGGEELQRAVIGRTADILALEVLRLLDRSVRLHRDGEGRAVEHHVDADGRRRIGARLAAGERDQRVDVAEAHVIGAGAHRADRRARAIALVDVEFDAGLPEIAVVLREEEPALRPLVAPVQHHLEADRCGLGDGRGGRHEGKKGRGGSATDDEPAAEGLGHGGLRARSGMAHASHSQRCRLVPSFLQSAAETASVSARGTTCGISRSGAISTRSPAPAPSGRPPNASTSPPPPSTAASRTWRRSSARRSSTGCRAACASMRPVNSSSATSATRSPTRAASARRSRTSRVSARQDRAGLQPRPRLPAPARGDHRLPGGFPAGAL